MGFIAQRLGQAIRYNYLKIIVTSEIQIYKLPKSNQIKKIQEVQLKDLDLEQYKNKEVIYILRLITEEFIREFYKGIT